MNSGRKHCGKYFSKVKDDKDLSEFLKICFTALVTLSNGPVCVLCRGSGVKLDGLDYSIHAT